MVEDDYCRAFADALIGDEPFRHWVITQTKFYERRRSTLLFNEQAARPAKDWWRHWWVKLPDGSQSETDIFLVFCDQADGTRFALHVECKLGGGKFTPNQAAQYAARGAFMKQNRWVPYNDFDTVLLPPKDFIERFAQDAEAFGSTLTFEHRPVAPQIRIMPNF